MNIGLNREAHSPLTPPKGNPEYYDFLMYIQSKKVELQATGAATDENDFLQSMATLVAKGELSIKQATEKIDNLFNSRSSYYH